MQQLVVRENIIHEYNQHSNGVDLHWQILLVESDPIEMGVIDTSIILLDSCNSLLCSPPSGMAATSSSSAGLFGYSVSLGYLEMKQCLSQLGLRMT